jgi:hypothetical protein
MKRKTLQGSFFLYSWLAIGTFLIKIWQFGFSFGSKFGEFGPFFWMKNTLAVSVLVLF